MPGCASSPGGGAGWPIPCVAGTGDCLENIKCQASKLLLTMVCHQRATASISYIPSMSLIKSNFKALRDPCLLCLIIFEHIDSDQLSGRSQTTTAAPSRTTLNHTPCGHPDLCNALTLYFLHTSLKHCWCVSCLPAKVWKLQQFLDEPKKKWVTPPQELWQQSPDSGYLYMTSK